MFVSVKKHVGRRQLWEEVRIRPAVLLLSSSLFLAACGGTTNDASLLPDLSGVATPAPDIEETPGFVGLPTPVPTAPTPVSTPVATLPSPAPASTPAPISPAPTPIPTRTPNPLEPTPSPNPTLPTPTPTPTPTPDAVLPTPEPSSPQKIDRADWVLSASNNEADLYNAIDDDAQTRWTSRQTLTPNQWIAIDLGAVYQLDGIVIDSEQSPNDFAPLFDLQLSINGLDWSTALTGIGDGATTEIPVDGSASARHIRIIQLGSSSQWWWSIHELDVFGQLDFSSPTPIATPTPTPDGTPSPLPVPSPTPSPIETPQPTPTLTPVPAPVPTPVSTPTPLPTPVPTPGMTDFEIGALLYAEHCAACHRELSVSDKRNYSEAEISASLSDIPQMRNIDLTAQQIAYIAIALNTDSVTPNPTPTPIEGEQPSIELGYQLYVTKGCATCHGDIADSSKRGAEEISISYALENEVEMENLSLSELEIASITLALADDEGICRDQNDPGPVVMRRLSNAEYVNTVRDLLGVPIDPTVLPGDSIAGNFTNIGSATVNSEHAIGYAAVVPEIADAINDSSNQVAQSYVSCDIESAGISCANTIISEFLPRAFRRDAGNEELTYYSNIFEAATSNGLDDRTALAITLEAILLSPNFSFIVELDDTPTDTVNAHALTEFELASRLSYFIWASMPDAILFDLARAGELSEPAELDQQIDRMLADSKSDALVDTFFSEWMNLVEFADPNTTEYTYIEAALRADMLEESKWLFKKQFLENQNDLRELLTTKTTYHNQALADHYGVSTASGEAFVEVATSDQRAGVLGHASILVSTSQEHETQPVARGKWVLDQLLCESPRTPPPGVGELPEEVDENMTLKEQLATHRSDPACAACHETMDPLGFGFESFDERGRFRLVYHNGHAVDSFGELPDGRIFEGVVELADVLQADSRFQSCVTEKFYSYARGALAGARDNCAVNEIADDAVASGFTVNSVIKAIVNSNGFLTRRSADAENEVTP